MWNFCHEKLHPEKVVAVEEGEYGETPGLGWIIHHSLAIIDNYNILSQYHDINLFLVSGIPYFLFLHLFSRNVS